MSESDRFPERLKEELVLRDLGGLARSGPTSYQFLFERDAPLNLVVESDRFAFYSGTRDRPDITLYIDSRQTLEALLRGELDGMDAFMSGRYRADGNIVLSQLLLYQFAVRRGETP